MRFVLIAFECLALFFQVIIAREMRLTGEDEGQPHIVSESGYAPQHHTDRRPITTRILNGLQDLLDSAGADENDKTTAGTSHHCSKRGLSTFNLKLRTDIHGNKISWQLKSRNDNEILASVDVGTYHDHEEYSETICVPARDECLSFVIRDGDENGDGGSCCPTGSGFYEVWLDNMQIGSSDGSHFDGEDVIDFGNCPVDKNDNEGVLLESPTTNPQHNSTQTMDSDTMTNSNQNSTNSSDLEQIIDVPQSVVCDSSDYVVRLRITTEESGYNSFVQVQDMNTNRVVYRDDNLESYSTSSLHFCLPGDTCYNATIYNSARGSFSLDIDSGQVVPNRSYSSGADSTNPNSMITISKVFGDCASFLGPSGLPDSTGNAINTTEKVFFPPFRIALTFVDKGISQDWATDPENLGLVESATTRFLDDELHRIYSNRYAFTELAASLPQRDRKRRAVRSVRYRETRGLETSQRLSTELSIQGAAFFEDGKAPSENGLRAELENSFEDIVRLTNTFEEMGNGEFDKLQSAKAFFPSNEQIVGETNGGGTQHHNSLPSKALVIAICVSSAIAFSAVIAVIAVLGAKRREEKLKSRGITTSLGTDTRTFSLPSLGGSLRAQKKKEKIQVEKAPSDVGLCDMEQGCSTSSANASSSPSVDDYFEDIVEADDSRGRSNANSKGRLGSLSSGRNFLSKEASKLEKSVLGITTNKVKGSKVVENPDRDGTHQFRREDFEDDNNFGCGGTMFL